MQPNNEEYAFDTAAHGNGPRIYTQNVSKFNKAEISLAVLSDPNVIIFKIDTKQTYNRLKKKVWKLNKNLTMAVTII